jgi:uncharacterized protein YjbI with pentapeptide repeats
MSDTTAETPATDAPKIGKAWGDDISEDRRRELDKILAVWDTETEHYGRLGPFDVRDLRDDEQERFRLSGADVFYLANQSGRDASGAVPNLHLEVANLSGAHLRGANLREAQMFAANLREVDFTKANLCGAILAEAELERANLSWAQLERADLSGAHLKGAFLPLAKLAGANLSFTQLAGAGFSEAQLVGADLRFAQLDRDTHLNDANLRGISVDLIELGNANLTVVSWDGTVPLGDETRARAATDDDGRRKSQYWHIEHHKAAVRANRLLATALRAQGLNEESDTFAYRAQLMQRGLRFQQRQFGRWLVSWGLAALSGYGYRLWRIFAVYGAVLAIFALIFWALGVHSFAAEPGWQALWDSFLVSLSAIHGRATFETLGAWTPAAWVAAIESVVGIVIEGVFVAMLIQRLFR